MDPVLVTVTVYALACRQVNHSLQIMVKVPADQEALQHVGGQGASTAPAIIDLLGGEVKLKEFLEARIASHYLREILVRKVKQSTGCTIMTTGEFSPPFVALTKGSEQANSSADLAFWLPVLWQGIPHRSAAVIDYPWITSAQFEAGTHYRPIGLGSMGRTGQILRAGFLWYHTVRYNSAVFSKE